ncbi:uncharacterized protein LOC144098487 isoform X2 [Amblyomma americanum]
MLHIDPGRQEAPLEPIAKGLIASLDAFMPSNGIYRNVSHTNMGILKAMLETAVNNIAARYGVASNQSGADGSSASEERQGFSPDVNDTSPLLVRNRSLAFHAEIRHQYHLPVEAHPLVHPPDAVTGNSTSHGVVAQASLASAQSDVVQEPRSDLDKRNPAANLGQSENSTIPAGRRSADNDGVPLRN